MKIVAFGFKVVLHTKDFIIFPENILIAVFYIFFIGSLWLYFTYCKITLPSLGLTVNLI